MYLIVTGNSSRGKLSWSWSNSEHYLTLSHPALVGMKIVGNPVAVGRGEECYECAALLIPRFPGGYCEWNSHCRLLCKRKR